MATLSLKESLAIYQELSKPYFPHMTPCQYGEFLQRKRKKHKKK